jgi:MerR family transcriptional regulator, copper efflux regulator
MARLEQSKNICAGWGLQESHGLEPARARPISNPQGEALMFIGEIAAQAGVSVQAVRLYERRGLMRRAVRSAANYRHYEPIDLDILKTIAQCQRFGFTLAEIRKILSLFWVPDPATGRPRHKPNEAQCLIDACAIGERKLVDLDARIADLERARGELGQALGALRGRIAQAAAPLDPVPRVRREASAATTDGALDEIPGDCPCGVDPCRVCAGES